MPVPHPTVGTAAAAQVDEDERYVAYGFMASCLLAVLVCVLLSAVNLNVTRARAITGMVAILVLFAIVGWFSSTCFVAARQHMRSGAAAAGRLPAAASAARGVRLVRRCACGGLESAAIGALPTFAYEGPRPAANDGGAAAGEDDGPRASCQLCSVCLEELRAGEMVRRLPPCGHVFHVDCIDMWLRTHRTCPMCRCDLAPRKVAAKAAAAAASQSSADAVPPAASQPSTDALPPV